MGKVFTVKMGDRSLLNLILGACLHRCYLQESTGQTGYCDITVHVILEIVKSCINPYIVHSLLIMW